MRYALLLHYPEKSPDDVGDDSWSDAQAAFQAYARDLHATGVLVSGEIWQPSSATTSVTASGGTLHVQDGPFADTREQLGGVFVIDVPDLDAALAWAEKAPSIQWGTIEIRPSGTHVVDGSWVAEPDH